jgi:hypothetical protein
LSTAAPDLSVVLVTDSLRTSARTLRHLRAQTAAGRLELLLIVERGTPVDLEDRALAGFWGVQLVEVDSIDSHASAREPGIRVARAPVVALAENHAYHAPGWAEGLIAAHRAPWVAVGPGVSNANPSYAVSWANFLLDYGPWFEPDQGRELEDLPGHNSSYKRELLCSYDSKRLRELLESETFLHADLRSRGHRLWLEPAARIGHVNVSGPSAWFRERVAGGQRFAGARSARWSWLRRLGFVAGSPLIPLVRLVRIVPIWRRAATRHRLPRWLLPALLFSLTASALGELRGYLTGSGDAMCRLSLIELDREKFLRPDELPALDQGRFSRDALDPKTLPDSHDSSSAA